MISLPAVAGDPWKLPASRWTEADARQILCASPWAKTNHGSKAIVRWESARSVQLALEKLNFHRSEADYRSHYAVSIVGVPLATRIPKLEARLKAAGRNSVPSVNSEVEDNMIIFYFNRVPALQQPVVFRLPGGLNIGNIIEFQGRIGDKTVKQVFSLRSMTLDGKLDL